VFAEQREAAGKKPSLSHAGAFSCMLALPIPSENFAQRCKKIWDPAAAYEKSWNR
jgi:hypothetical protein